MQYSCDLHDDDRLRPAALSVMVVETGEVLNVCQGCVPTWGLIIAGVTPNLVDTALEQLHALETGEPAPAPRKRAPRKATAKQQEQRVKDELAKRRPANRHSGQTIPGPDEQDGPGPEQDTAAGDPGR